MRFTILAAIASAAIVAAAPVVRWPTVFWLDHVNNRDEQPPNQDNLNQNNPTQNTPNQNTPTQTTPNQITPIPDFPDCPPPIIALLKGGCVTNPFDQCFASIPQFPQQCLDEVKKVYPALPGLPASGN
jgi:hypothetical protein